MYIHTYIYISLSLSIYIYIYIYIYAHTYIFETNKWGARAPRYLNNTCRILYYAVQYYGNVYYTVLLYAYILYYTIILCEGCEGLDGVPELLAEPLNQPRLAPLHEAGHLDVYRHYYQ